MTTNGNNSENLPEKTQESNIQETPEAIIARIKNNQTVVREMMKSVLRNGEHYGTVPGTGDKPALMKSGAEVMAFTFRLDPEYQIKITDLKDGHRDYLITCTIYSVETGKRLGSGSGSCSTMESKYRYRNVADYQVTDLPIPKDSKEKKAEYRKQGFGMKKVDGLWVWVKFTDSSKQENPDIADVYNTALKMGQKRAFVAAILTVLAVSDMFTQDIEDSLPEKEIHPPSGPIPENMDPKTGEEIEPKKPENVPNEEKTPEEALNILKAAISDLRFSKEPDEKKIELARKFLANWKTRKYSKTIMDSGLKEIKNLLGNLGEEEVLF